MLWAPQVFTCGVSTCAFPPHTLECVCVCVSHVWEFCLHEAHCKLILYWQLLSGRWSHFCGGPHTACVCVYVSICLSVPGRLLWCHLEAGLNSEQMCVGYSVSLRNSSPGMEAGLAASQRQPFSHLSWGSFPSLLFWNLCKDNTL